jgi:hypothetical protein
MAIELDHIILAVNDRAKSIDFYTKIVGLGHDGDREPFSMLRVSPGLIIQIARGAQMAASIWHSLCRSQNSMRPSSALRWRRLPSATVTIWSAICKGPDLRRPREVWAAPFTFLIRTSIWLKFDTTIHHSLAHAWNA